MLQQQIRPNWIWPEMLQQQFGTNLIWLEMLQQQIRTKWFWPEMLQLVSDSVFCKKYPAIVNVFSGTCWDLKILNSIKEPLTAAVEVRSWTYHFPHICNERHLLVSFCKLSLSRFVVATFQAKLSLSWIVAATFQAKLRGLRKPVIFGRSSMFFAPFNWSWSSSCI